MKHQDLANKVYQLQEIKTNDHICMFDEETNVDENLEAIETQFVYQHIIKNRVKQGKYQLFAMIPMCSLTFLDGGLIMMLSYLVPLFQSVWNINEMEKSLITQTIFIGMIFGCLIGGYLADNYGRRIVIQLSFIIVTTFSFLSAFSQNISQFIILMITGMVGVGMSTTCGSTYISEINTRENAKINIIATGILFPLGQLLNSIYAYFCFSSLKEGHWRLFIILSSLTCLPVLYVLYHLDESPQFYLLKKKYQQAFDVIDKAILTNNRNGQILTESEKQLLIQSEESKCISSSNYLELFNDTHRFKTIVMASIWFGVNLVSFGCIFIFPYIVQMYSNSLRLNQSVQQKSKDNLVEVIESNFPAVLICLLTIIYSKFQQIDFRRFIICQFIACLLMLMISLNQEQYFEKILIIIRSIIGLTFTSLYVYTAQLYPTEIKAIAYGFLSLFARFGGLVMPYIFFGMLKFGIHFMVQILLYLTLVLTLISLLIPKS